MGRRGTASMPMRKAQSQRTQIRQRCTRSTREFQPEKIILFGSHASGQPKAASALDMLVVMPLAAIRWNRRFGRAGHYTGRYIPVYPTASPVQLFHQPVTGMPLVLVGCRGPVQRTPQAHQHLLIRLQPLLQPHLRLGGQRRRGRRLRILNREIVGGTVVDSGECGSRFNKTSASGDRNGTGTTGKGSGRLIDQISANLAWERMSETR